MMKKQQDDTQQQQQQGGTPPKLFIGGLTPNTTKEHIEQHFSKYGQIVDSIVMKNQQTGQSRGFGFITFKEMQSAQDAIQGQNRIDNKNIDVKFCHPRTQQHGGGGGGGAYGHQQQQGRQPYQQPQQPQQPHQGQQRHEFCKVFIGGLPYGVQDEEITQLFQRFGPVKEFKMIYDEAKKPRGYGFITFDYEESANQALMEHYLTFKGKQIEVKPQSKLQSQQQQGFASGLVTPSYGGSMSNINLVNPLTQQASSIDPYFAAQQQQQWPATAHQQSSYGAEQASWNYAGTGATAVPQTGAQNWSSLEVSGGYGNYGASMQPGAAQQQQAQNWNYNYYGQTASQQAYYDPANDPTGTYGGSSGSGYADNYGYSHLAGQTTAPSVTPTAIDPYQQRIHQSLSSSSSTSNGRGTSSGGGGSSRQKINPTQQRPNKSYSSSNTQSGPIGATTAKRQQTGSSNGTSSYHPYRR